MIYIYIYIYRQAARDSTYLSVSDYILEICMYIYIHIMSVYIYIYRYNIYISENIYTHVYNRVP